MVFPYRPACRVTELIAPQLGLSKSKFIREVIVGIQLFVAQKLEDVAVKAVGAGFRDGVHHRAAEFPVLGIETIGDEAKFLHRVQIRYQTRAEVSPLTDIATVHQEGVGRFALAIDGDVACIQDARNRTVLLDRLVGVARGNARL